MTPKLKISEFVVNRLSAFKPDENASGSLFGLMYSGTLIVLGFDFEVSNGKTNLKDNFPTEIDLCGGFIVGDVGSEDHFKDIFKDIDITDNPVLLKCSNENGFSITATLCKNGQLEDIKFEIVSESQLYQEFFFVRLIGFIEVAFENNSKSIKQELVNVRKKLSFGNVLFKLQGRNIFFDNNNFIGLDSESKLLDVLEKSIKVEEVVGKGKSKKEKELNDFQIVNVECLVKKSEINEKSERVALRISIEKDKMIVPMHIDALSALHIETPTNLFYDILVESLCCSLRLVEQNLLEQLEYLPEIHAPLTYHFKPQELGHFYTCVYADGVKEEEKILLEKRQELHRQFRLPVKPCFRKANKYKFAEDYDKKYLINTHIGLKNYVVGGKQYLVHGKYAYHHYMQDNFDDSGWGCAYRSLQTLCSWFRLQGYTEHPVPSHEAIQKYLVKIGDKPASFVNSRQWIGSTEVSMCLNGFMDVDSKIMHVSSGGEMAGIGSELIHHFEKQGTPIMIGGGVLAHTILGVDFNNATGDLKFLILDPHYTGQEDLQLIQNKGWCNWKNCEFWDKRSYYNLCMPQKPMNLI